MEEVFPKSLLLCLFNNNLIIMIITLFQEDNIFDTDASLTHGPPLTDVDMLLK